MYDINAMTLAAVNRLRSQELGEQVSALEVQAAAKTVALWAEEVAKSCLVQASAEYLKLVDQEAVENEPIPVSYRFGDFLFGNHTPAGSWEWPPAVYEAMVRMDRAKKDVDNAKAKAKRDEDAVFTEGVSDRNFKISVVKPKEPEDVGTDEPLG